MTGPSDILWRQDLASLPEPRVLDVTPDWFRLFVAALAGLSATAGGTALRQSAYPATTKYRASSCIGRGGTPEARAPTPGNVGPRRGGRARQLPAGEQP